ncbi:MAG: outer membrane lipoprotein carrier protein LolA [Bacteroidales bacterium]|nr:outer membrane lipoprotein carrier protein LolA [Bacteroidales bacterium]
MKRLLYLLVWICSVNMLSAQTAKTQTNKYVDTQSKEILDAMYKKMLSYSNVNIQFTFRTEKNAATLSEMKGTIWVKGSQYKLTTPEQQVYCNAKDVWTYLPEQKEVSISAYDSTDVEQLNPLQVVKDYQKHYRSTFIREESRRGVLVQIIDLTPKSATSVAKVRLIIDKAKNQIVNVVIYEKDGTMYHYIVEKFSVNQKLTDATFVFDTAAHPDVDVIDMR